MSRYLKKEGRPSGGANAARGHADCFYIFSSAEGTQSDRALHDAFNIFDATGDGLIDEDEFLSLLPLLGEEVPGQLVRKLFEAIDENESGTISCDEFVQFVRRANPCAVPPRPGGRLESNCRGWRLGGDGDGLHG